MLHIHIAHTHEDEGNLIYLHISGTAPTRELAVIRHLQRYQSRGAEQFLALLRDHAQHGGFSTAPIIAAPPPGSQDSFDPGL